MAANRIGKILLWSRRDVLPPYRAVSKMVEREEDLANPLQHGLVVCQTKPTRDIVQAELLGSPDDPEAFGSGAVPRECIIKTERKPGVPNAKSVALIRHISGENSSLFFKAYEMGVDKWQGRSVDVVWLDEEPSRELYSQSVTRTLDRRGNGLHDLHP